MHLQIAASKKHSIYLLDHFLIWLHGSITQHQCFSARSRFNSLLQTGSLLPPWFPFPGKICTYPLLNCLYLHCITW